MLSKATCTAVAITDEIKFTLELTCSILAGAGFL